MKIHLKKDMEIIPKKKLSARQTPLHLCLGAENCGWQPCWGDVIESVSEPTEWIAAGMFVKKTNLDVKTGTDKLPADDKASGAGAGKDS